MEITNIADKLHCDYVKNSEINFSDIKYCRSELPEGMNNLLSKLFEGDRAIIFGDEINGVEGTLLVDCYNTLRQQPNPPNIPPPPPGMPPAEQRRLQLPVTAPSDAWL